MRHLAWVLLRAQGLARLTLLAGCTAVTSTLLLLIIALLRLPGSPYEVLYGVIADPGTRPGAVLALALTAAPVMLLLWQTVQLGSAHRDRRLATLRLAGATRTQIRTLGAIEVGLPATLGAAAGLGLYILLRTLFGGRPGVDTDSGGLTVSNAPDWMALVPVTAVPSWWQVLAVVVGIALLGAGIGWRVTGAVLDSPLMITRRQLRPPPRPWGLIPLAASLVALPFILNSESPLPILILVGLCVAGLLGVAPAAGYYVGRLTQRRTQSVAVLLAARRLVTEPRTVGRAAAAVSAIALVTSGLGGTTAILVAYAADPEDYTEFGFYVIAMILVAVLILVALLMVTASIAVHSVESLRERARAMAALQAGGMPYEVVERAQRWEAGLVALPMATLGFGVGAVGMFCLSYLPEGFHLSQDVLIYFGIQTVAFVLTLGLVLLAVVISHRLLRPWSRRAVSTAGLRTE